jgi:hypothetical protein
MSHGTISSYTKGRCRCESCRGAWRDWQREAWRRRRRGEYRWVSPAAARRHVRSLMADGMSIIAIATAAGLSRRTVANLMAGDQKSIHVRTVDKLMAVCADDWPENVSRPACEAVALLDRLRAAGVKRDTVREVLHISAPHLLRKQRTVRAKTLGKLRVGLAMAARDGLLREELP